MEKNTLVSFYFLSFLAKVSIACDQTIPILGTNLAEYFSRRSFEVWILFSLSLSLASSICLYIYRILKDTQYFKKSSNMLSISSFGQVGDWDILISIRFAESKLGVIHKAEVVYSQTILVPSHTQINKAMPCYLVHLNFCYILCT